MTASRLLKDGARAAARPRTRLPIQLARADSVLIRGRGFWAGHGGLAVAVLTMGIVIALLVGWVLAWAHDEDGPNAVWLTLGPVAFSIVLALLAWLFWSLRRTRRLRQVEIAFLTGASHNLRTPLTTIRTALQTLASTRGKLAAEDEHKLFEAVINGTHRLELHIETLIETARLDLEHRPYELGPLDLVALVRDVVASAHWAFAAQGGTAAAPQADEPMMIVGDVRALTLLFENLIDNALKYAVGPPRVDVHCVRSADHAVVRVTDHGVGFSSGDAPLVFSGRRRGDTQRKGTGLGLRLCRAIARGHGGEVRLHSKGEGQGATAEVWLPLDDTTGEG